jgi:hypothetical protein
MQKPIRQYTCRRRCRMRRRADCRAATALDDSSWDDLTIPSGRERACPFDLQGIGSAGDVLQRAGSEIDCMEVVPFRLVHRDHIERIGASIDHWRAGYTHGPDGCGAHKDVVVSAGCCREAESLRRGGARPVHPIRVISLLRRTYVASGAKRTSASVDHTGVSGTRTDLLWVLY